MQEQSQGRLDAQFPFKPSAQVLTSLRLLMSVLEARFAPLEESKSAYDAAVNELIQVGLFRIDDVLRPALIELDKAANTGFPVARITDAGVAGSAVLKANTHGSLLDALALTAADLSFLAPKASPAFTGSPTAPTQSLSSNSTALATTAFCQALVAALVNSAPAALDTVRELADALGNDANFSTTVLNALADRYTKAQADAAFTRRRNFIVNPGMRWSEEKFDAVTSFPAGNNALYPIDGFCGVANITGAISMQRIKVRSPGGSLYRLRATVVTAQAAPAAGHYCGIKIPLEGFDISELGWGTPAAKPATLQFVASLPAGKYTVAVRNRPETRSYLVQFTVTSANAGTDQTYTFLIPAQTSGVWAENQNLGLQIDLSFMVGSDYVGAAGWQTGTFLAISGQSNMLATQGAIAELMDVALYAGSVAPPFQLPDFFDDLRRCQRYFAYMKVNVSQKGNSGSYAGSREPLYFPVSMRDTPFITVPPGMSGQVNNGAGGYRQPTAADLIVNSYTSRTGGAWLANMGLGGDFVDFDINLYSRL